MKTHRNNPTAFFPPLSKGRLGGVKIMCSFTENWYNRKTGIDQLIIFGTISNRE
jgi:hypothetical protein